MTTFISTSATVDCKHLQLCKLAPDNPANELHQGPWKAYHCHECGLVFYVDLTAATIKVSHGIIDNPPA